MVQELAALSNQATLSPGFITRGKTGRKEASKPTLSHGVAARPRPTPPPPFPTLGSKGQQETHHLLPKLLAQTGLFLQWDSPKGSNPTITSQARRPGVPTALRQPLDLQTNGSCSSWLSVQPQKRKKRWLEGSPVRGWMWR